MQTFLSFFNRTKSYITLSSTRPALRNILINDDSWIIQDGNYGDFAVGDSHKFAFEFTGGKSTSSDPGERSAKLLHTNVYRVHAQVIFVDPRVWVIDFGLRAFWEFEPPAFVQAGSWVEGEVAVGIDPFFYKEYLQKISEMPNLFNDWKVVAMSRDDTPWI